MPNRYSELVKDDREKDDALEAPRHGMQGEARTQGYLLKGYLFGSPARMLAPRSGIRIRNTAVAPSARMRRPVPIKGNLRVALFYAEFALGTLSLPRAQSRKTSHPLYCRLTLARG